MNKFLSLSLIPLAATATVASVMMASAPAKAITLTPGGTLTPNGFLTTSVVGATVIDFNSGSLPSIYTGGSIVGPGSTIGSYTAPLLNFTPFYSVGPSTSTPGIIKQAAGRPAWNYFGLYWGSIDRYNRIAFYNNDSLVQDFNGADASLFPIGIISRYINFNSTGPADYFDEIRFSSPRNAFESDNHAFKEVPEPLTIRYRNRFRFWWFI
jgi:hypothetical protein